MKTLSTEELNDILAKHKLFLEGSPDGIQARFSGCVLEDEMFPKGINLSHIDFSGAKVLGCSLDRVVFSRANLTGAVFKGCRLTNCNFNHCFLTKTVFRGCDLVGALFTNDQYEAYPPTFNGCCMIDVQFGL